MSHETEDDVTLNFGEQCRREIDEMRDLCERILAYTPQRADQEQLSWLVRWLFHEPGRSFDSRTDPKMALLTRAASKSQVVPYVTIQESSWAKQLTLLGKNPRTGDAVAVMKITIPRKEAERFATTVIMCQDIFIQRIPYHVFVQSYRAALISDVLVPSLRAIDSYLGAIRERGEEL